MPNFLISRSFLVSGTHKVISPLLYVPHNDPALPKKSAKIEICQQSKLNVPSSSADTHTVKV